ncbi:type I polyketide synthase [Tabrizicola sp. TH137]|uniref:type I polyketide synthase n=1 Tax=Tabrizicola sp. TH137 TaxID=2067452 RepID=UPI0013046DC2|nr:type I polyketide synthase [Tabrizicola sp. TH137]
MSRKIYVTGRACRLPGAATIDALSSVLFSGRDTVTEVPADRWAQRFFLHPTPGTKGKTYTFAAGIVDDLWSFDVAPFGISPREAGQMDPQQRLLLQVVWEALEDAGLPPDRLAGQHVGVYAGCSAMAHAARLAQDAAITDAHLMTGNTMALVSNRVSHVLDLRGPSMTVDTACSSSIVAMRLAEEALLRGEIDVAVVAGVNALLDPIHFIGFSAARMLSPTGRCQPFSAAADGYVRAEGAVAFVLERRTARELAPRCAHAVLRAVEVNTDGRTLNVALPSLEGQAALLRKVYARAEVDPAALAFVEAHGTGTLAGDPVEAGALGRVLGQARTVPLPIGSVKSNIGHLEPASGVAGMLKALIALEHRMLPPSLHAESLNPGIDFEGLNLQVARAALPLGEGPLLAGVSSFGFGGANAHVILERPVEAPASVSRKPAEAAPMLLLTAAGDAALGRMMAAWQPLVAAEDKDGLQDLCGQAAAHRGRLPHRAVVLCDDAGAAAAALARGAAGQADPRLVTGRSELVEADVAFVFSGNGSQYAGMGLAALARDAAYAKEMRRIDRAFRAIAGWSILEKLQAPDLDAQLRDAAVAQPLLFADQMAQVRAYGARGLRPAAVMGHSGGEVAAACAAGALTLQQALEVTFLRSIASQHLRGTGGMLAIQAPAAEVRAAMAAFGDGLELAAENSPRSVSVVGEGEALEAFLRHVRRVLRWPAVKLAIDYPYHSRAFDGVAADLRLQLRKLRPGAARVAFVSSVTGQEMAGTDLIADHWAANVRQPVAFAPAMAALRARGIKAYLEVGASPVLQGYMAGCLEGEGSALLPGLERGDGEALAGGINPVEKVVARAVVAGVKLAGGKVLPPATGHRRDLPTYPWDATEVRIDRTPGILNRLGDGLRQHPFLGREEGVEARVWYSNIDAVMVPALGDHRPGGRVILPGTWIAEVMLAAAAEVFGQPTVTLHDLDLMAPVVLTRQNLTEVQVRALPEQGRVTLACRGRGDAGGYRLHAQGRMERGQTVPDAREAAPDRMPQAGDRGGARIYATAARLGLHYGPAFALVERERRVAPGVVEVFLRESPPLDAAETRLLLDVAGADAAFHALIPALDGTEFERLGLGFVPVRIGRLVLLKAGARVASARLRLRRKGVRSAVADVVLFDREGAVVARIEAVRFQAVRMLREASLSQHGFRQIALPLSGRPDVDGLVAEVKGALRAEGCPEEAGYFLVEAAAQALACEGLRLLARQGMLHAPLPSAWVEAMAGVALRAGMIVPVAGGWEMTEAGKAAQAAPLVALIGAEHPELVAEHAILTQLIRRLPDLVRLGPEDMPRPEAVFGRAALDSLAKGSVFRHRRSAAFAAAVQAAVGGLPRGGVLRIAEVVEEGPRLLPRLLAGIAPERAVFAEIVPPGAEEGPVLHPDRVSRVEATVPGLRAAGGFDLILSDGALSALGLPFQRLSEGLAAGGRILALEPEPSDFADLVWGLDAGWFAGGMTPEGPLSPLQTGADWIAAAQGAGMRAEAQALPEACGAANLVAAGRLEETAAAEAQGDPALAMAIAEALQRSEDSVQDVDGWRLAVFPPGGAGGEPVTALAARVLALRDLVTAAQGVRLLLVVPGGSALGDAATEPGQVAVWTLIRSAANEHPTVPMLRCDPEPGLAAEEAGLRIAGLIAAGSPETEVVIGAGGAAALRVMQGVVAPRPQPGHAEDRAVLRAAAAGGIDDLRWVREPRRAPGPGEVEIAVAATGLNYRDVMWSMGMLPEEALERGFAGPTIGLECAGHVLRCGPGVTGLAPGDAVMTFGPSSFASHVTVRAELAARLPDGLTPEAAATVPVAFFTAWYALVTLGGAQAGDWVLIHGAAGGVGLAAIQIARLRGLRVIATAGSEVKRSLLMAEGVEHVLDSRTLDFAEEVRAITGGRGVDAVLNGLAGMAMERSLACLAPFGRFLELGKQDFYANTAVGLRPLKENIVYHGIDVDQVMAARPDVAARVFAEVMAAFSAGALRPLPYRAFAADEAVAAFRLMQKSGHVGKIVVTPPDPAIVQDSEGALGRFAPSQTGWHLVVGGLGGLGLEVAEWLVAAGVRRLALMSRRGSAEGAAAEAVVRWQEQGVEVRPIACDVADEAALTRALGDLVPLAGVIHSAMVLEDMPLAQVTGEVLERVLPAKVAGAAHLDRLTRGMGLQYFVLFSSMATLIGNHGQSAYVAANGYLEGIARARRAAGLPGLAVGWGAISDVGYLVRDRETAALVRRMSGGTEFTGVQVTRALERLLAMGDAVDPVVHVSPMGWNAVSVTLRTLGEPAFGLLRALGRRAEADAGEDDLRVTLAGMTEARAAERLEAWLVGRVAHILQVPEKAVAATKPVADLGVDSLMGVELGLTVQQALGDDIPVSLISDALSLREIALRIVHHLHGTGGAEPVVAEVGLAEQHLASVAGAPERRPEAAE